MDVQDTRVVDTPKLLELAEAAAASEYNRQLDLPELRSVLDPQGNHAVVPMLWHEHKNGSLTDPHMRCQVLIKVKDTMQPLRAMLDINLDTFAGLPTVAEYVEKNN